MVGDTHGGFWGKNRYTYILIYYILENLATCFYQRVTSPVPVNNNHI